MKKMCIPRIYRFCVVLIVLMLMQSHAFAQSIDPLGCTNLSDNQLRKAGYETVRSHGAVGNGTNDDTNEIQAAIDAALENRRMVYFHPGDYLVTDTLQVRQELRDTNGNLSTNRFGVTLIGSYCGNEKPIIRFPDLTGDLHAKETDEKVIAENPKPVILLMREQEEKRYPNDQVKSEATNGRQPSRSDDVADDSDSARDWNQVVRNLHIITGPNSGVVGIRHMGAEGSAAQEVKIDATDAFAGFYHVNSSGGYTYNVEVIGGKYGFYIPLARGGSILISGLKMRGQEEIPIVINHYSPLVLVAADIKHKGSVIVGGIDTNQNTVIESLKGSDVSGGHLTLIDGQIEITDSSNRPVFNNQPTNRIRGGRSVYMKNMYFRTPNNRTVLENGSGSGSAGSLSMAGGNKWYHVTEYNSSNNFDTLPGPGGETKLIRGVTTEDTFYADSQCGNNQLCDRTLDLKIFKEVNQVPASLQSKHFYADALCNVEAKGTVFVSPIDAGEPLDPSIKNGTGAIAEDESEHPDDNDRKAVQDAINYAASSEGNKRVFIPAGEAIFVPADGNEPAKTLIKHYTVRGTLDLKGDVHLCGASRSTTVLSAGRNGSNEDIRDDDHWPPEKNSPIIRSEREANSSVVLGDLSIYAPVTDTKNLKVSEYGAHVYQLHWRSGRDSVVKDVWWRHDFGNPGKRVSVHINQKGGGRWFGITQQNGYPPRFDNGNSPDSNTQSFTHYQEGDLVLSPESKHMLIKGTTEPLTFYPFHCQHLTLPYGSQCDIVEARNVTLFGIKQEAASTPQIIADVIRSNSNPAIVPIWMRIRDSHNINLFGYESHSEYAKGRAKIEISGENSNITIANMAAREFPNTVFPTNEWYFVKETVNGSDNVVSVESHIMPLFKSVDFVDEEICVPLKSKNNKIAVICL